MIYINKLRLVFLFLLIFSAPLLIQPFRVLAADCGSYSFTTDANELKLNISTVGLALDPQAQYSFEVTLPNNNFYSWHIDIPLMSNTINELVIKKNPPQFLVNKVNIITDPNQMLLLIPQLNAENKLNYKVIDYGPNDILCSGVIEIILGVNASCSISLSNVPVGGYQPGDTINFTGTLNTDKSKSNILYVQLVDPSNKSKVYVGKTCVNTQQNTGLFSGSISIDEGGTAGWWYLETYFGGGLPCSATGGLLCIVSVPILTSGSPPPNQQGEIVAKKICEFTTDPDCESCLAADGIITPFGCIKTNPQEFITDLLRIAIGIAGGIAFIMIVYGGFVIMTATGNPEKLTGGKEIIVSAISGLLLIVFSVVILKIIGVDILQIPGLG